MSKEDDVMALLSAAASGYAPKKEDRDPRKKSAAEKAKVQESIAAKMREAKDATSETCDRCGKQVYLAERREVEVAGKKEIFHKTCFKCTDCGLQLELNNYGSVNRIVYCKVHLKERNKTSTPAPSDNKGAKEANPEVAAKFKQFRDAGDSTKCSSCSKTVYAAEKIDVEIRGQKNIFHKACFKCSVCGLTLNLRNYGSLESVLYCQPHLKEYGPKMTRGDYFISPLHKEGQNDESESNSTDRPTSEVPEREQDQQPLREEKSSSSQPSETSLRSATESSAERDRGAEAEERAKRRERQKQIEAEEEKQRDIEFAKRKEERERRLREVSGDSEVSKADSSGDASSDDRRREREQRRKEREEARLREQEEDERRAATRKKEQEERRKQQEEETKRELEENERKAEERRKRLQALKDGS